MSINEVQIIAIGIYLVLFIIMVVFFEMRLDYIHRKHVEKIWPIGEAGLQLLDSKLKLVTRIIFALLFIVSISIILTLLGT